MQHQDGQRCQIKENLAPYGMQGRKNIGIKKSIEIEMSCLSNPIETQTIGKMQRNYLDCRIGNE
jgi:hypothetical protein